MTAPITTAPDTPVEEINRLFKLQQQNRIPFGNTTAGDRIARLEKLEKAILDHRQDIQEALYNDFRKHASEVDLTEIYPVISEIKHVKKHLKKWLRPQKVSTPITMLGSSSHIRYEPKGTVLIIAPWNFPVQLLLSPLITAIAGGNTVLLKPSENTPHVSALMHEMIRKIFPEKEVALVEGSVEVSKALLELPFNHIFFTGAPAIGKRVMEAASKHLTSVTLELGGKSPVIIDETADMDIAARRIMWGKFINNGQICIAPDYILVHQSQKEAFIEKSKHYLQEFFSQHPQKEPSYCRMVNKNHFERVQRYFEDAQKNGATIHSGGDFDASENYISPTLVSDVDMDGKLMTEEIFGPILPIVPFNDLKQATDLINSKPKPLSLYIFSKNKKNTEYLMSNTRAGGTCINHTIIHFNNEQLPFGGSNNSGIGKSHGWYGFLEFTNARSVVKQHIPGAVEQLMPPYTNFKQKLIDLTLKWF